MLFHGIKAVYFGAKNPNNPMIWFSFFILFTKEVFLIRSETARRSKHRNKIYIP